MGAAEFEFGALPKSTKYMREHAKEYVITKSNLVAVNGPDKGKPLWTLNREEDSATLSEYLGKVTKTTGHHRLKEPIWLDHHFTMTEDFGSRNWMLETVLWWDIENCLFISFKLGLLKKIRDELLKPLPELQQIKPEDLRVFDVVKIDSRDEPVRVVGIHNDHIEIREEEKRKKIPYSRIQRIVK